MDELSFICPLCHGPAKGNEYDYECPKCRVHVVSEYAEMTQETIDKLAELIQARERAARKVFGSCP